MAMERSIDIDISSAGTLAEPDAPATDGAILAGRKFGIDLSNHLSRPVTSDLIDSTSLVLCMERHHVMDLVTQHRADLAVVFSLAELARRAVQEPARSPTETLDDWLGRLGDGRSAASVLSGHRDDIADPIGRSNRVYRSAAREIMAAMSTVLEFGFEPSATPDNRTSSDLG